MNNKFKDAYLKYVGNFSKYTQLEFEKRESVVIKTTVEHFPHLVGMGHFPKYAKLTSKKFIDDITTDVINNSTINKSAKGTKTIINNKLEVFSKLESLVDSYLIEKPGEKISLGDKNECDALVYKIIGSKKFALIALKKDSLNIYHPTSVLSLKESQRKMLKLLSEKK